MIAEGYTRLDDIYRKISFKKLMFILMVITIVSIGYNHTRTTKYWYEDKHDGDYIVYVLESQETYSQSFTFNNDLTIDSLMVTFSDIHMDQALIHVDILVNGSTITSYDTTIHNDANLLETHQSLCKGDILTIELTNITNNPIFLGLSNITSGSAMPTKEVPLYLRYVLFSELKGNQTYSNDYYSYLPTY